MCSGPPGFPAWQDANRVLQAENLDQHAPCPPLSATIARRIERAYAKAIEKAAKNDLIGMDGVFYMFSTSDHSCALVWSPESQTRNGHLVALMHRLERHTTYSNSADLGSSKKAIEILLNKIE